MRQKNCKEYQAKPIKGATFQAIVERYNSLVDSGKDRARESRNQLEKIGKQGRELAGSVSLKNLEFWNIRSRHRSEAPKPKGT